MDKLAELSHGAKVVLGSAIAFLIVSFINWQSVYTPIGSYGRNMWHGVGVIAGLLAIALIAWQAVRLANINVEIGVTPSMITAVLAILLLVFTVITFFSHNEFRTFWAWLGLILAIMVVVGAWANMKAAGEGFAEVREKAASMTSSSKDAPPTQNGAPAQDAAPDATDGDDKPSA